MISVSDHALDRVRDRRLIEPYLVSRQAVIQLWRAGMLERWLDPDDPPGSCTLTSCSEVGVLVGRLYLPNRRVVVISALTLQQYENNKRMRWRAP